jgi:hypothetical protein
MILSYVNSFENKLKVGLCVIGKKENLYIEEFIEHYKKLGYDKIFLYDNNNKNGEHFEDAINKELLNNYVTIVNLRGFRGKKNAPQYNAYFDCYQKNSKNYDWLSFFDIDEYLVLTKDKSIKEFLSNERFKSCKNIRINWILYSDNDLIYYDNRSVQTRFTQPLLNDERNIHIKSTVRGKLKVNYWKRQWNPHSSLVNVTSCIPTGEIILNYSSPFQIPPNYDFAYLKHYNTKTIEEYINKIKRGRPTKKVIFNYTLWKSVLDHFFGRNKKTKKKIQYIKKTLNINYE